MPPFSFSTLRHTVQSCIQLPRLSQKHYGCPWISELPLRASLALMVCKAGRSRLLDHVLLLFRGSSMPFRSNKIFASTSISLSLPSKKSKQGQVPTGACRAVFLMRSTRLLDCAYRRLLSFYRHTGRRLV